MNPFIQDAIAALTAMEFVVETLGGFYTVARGGEVILRQCTCAQFLIFMRGFSAGCEATEQMLRRAASLEHALENSPHHQAALAGETPSLPGQSAIANRQS